MNMDQPPQYLLVGKMANYKELFFIQVAGWIYYQTFLYRYMNSVVQ